MFERTNTYTYLTPDQRHYVIDRSLEEAGLEEGPARMIEERFPAELAQWRSLDQRSLALQGNDLDHNPARRHLFAKTTAAQTLAALPEKAKLIGDGEPLFTATREDRS